MFFNRNSKGEIVQLEDNSWVNQFWNTLPFDWVGGEESLRMIYTIPKAGVSATRFWRGDLLRADRFTDLQGRNHGRSGLAQ